jgi:hypothetical protein
MEMNCGACELSRWYHVLRCHITWLIPNHQPFNLGSRFLMFNGQKSVIILNIKLRGCPRLMSRLTASPYGSPTKKHNDRTEAHTLRISRKAIIQSYQDRNFVGGTWTRLRDLKSFSSSSRHYSRDQLLTSIRETPASKSPRPTQHAIRMARFPFSLISMVLPRGKRPLLPSTLCLSTTVRILSAGKEYPDIPIQRLN